MRAGPFYTAEKVYEARLLAEEEEWATTPATEEGGEMKARSMAEEERDMLGLLAEEEARMKAAAEEEEKARFHAEEEERATTPATEEGEKKKARSMAKEKRSRLGSLAEE